MKLDTTHPHEESMCITYFLWGLTQRFQSYVPFFKTLICAYRAGVSIFFHSFQVNKMIFFMCLLIFGDKEEKGEIFITMNDSSPFLGTSKPFFQNNHLQYTISFQNRYLALTTIPHQQNYHRCSLTHVWRPPYLIRSKWKRKWSLFIHKIMMQKCWIVGLLY